MHGLNNDIGDKVDHVGETWRQDRPNMGDKTLEKDIGDMGDKTCETVRQDRQDIYNNDSHETMATLETEHKM